MKILSRCVAWCAFVALASLPTIAADAAGDFGLVGWQLHENDFVKLRDAVRRAPDYRVNFLIFSHELFRSVEGFLASTDNADPAHPPPSVQRLRLGSHFRIQPGLQSDLRRLGEQAAEEQIAYYLWVHEFDDVPKEFLAAGRVDMDNPGLMPYLRQRYESLLDAVPGCSGLVVTLHESDFKLFRNSEVKSRLSVPDRIYLVASFFRALLQARHKQLILRNFFYEPWEMAAFKEAVNRLPDDVMVMSKDTTHEFDPFYPWDPLHGQVGHKRQIMEIDLGVEKALGKDGVYVQAGYLQRAVERARETGLAGAVGRCRLVWARPFENAPEANLYAFSRFMTQPGLTAPTVVRDWVQLHYDPRAVPSVTSALLPTEDINHHARYHLGEWYTKAMGEEWGHYAYYFGHMKERAKSKWTHDPADEVLEGKLLDPDRPTFDRLVAEKDEVVREVEASQASIQRAKPWLAPAQAAYFQAGFDYLADAAQLEREWVRAFFAQEMFVHSGSPDCRAETEQALSRLEALGSAPGVEFGRDPATNDRYHIKEFVAEMRQRLGDRPRARDDDARILQKVQRLSEPR